MPLYTIKEKQILFLHIPKTGGASIERFLASHGPEMLKGSRTPTGLMCPPQHLGAAALKILVPTCDFSFTVVRNPYERLISEYLFRFAARRRPLPHFGVWWRYCKAMYRRNEYFLSNHLAPQTSFVDQRTTVYRFEDGVGSIISTLAKELGIQAPGTIPHVKQSPHVNLQIGVKTLRSIAQFYAADFERFCYDLDPAGVVESRRIGSRPHSALRWLLSFNAVQDLSTGVARGRRF